MSERLLDLMIAALGKARTEDREPHRWIINQHALDHLYADERLLKTDFHRSLEDEPLFGIPIHLQFTAETAPTFTLETYAQGDISFSLGVAPCDDKSR